MLGVVVAVAAVGRSSSMLMVEIEAAVGVAVSFADASMRPRRDGLPSTLAMVKVVSSLCQWRRGVASNCRRDRSVGGWVVGGQVASPELQLHDEGGKSRG